MFLFDAIGKLLVWLIKQLARLIAWLALQAFLHPRTTTSMAAAATSVVCLGWQLSLIILGGALTALSTWKAAHPASFSATVGTWTRSWWHRWWIYRRTWTEVFTRCDLTVQAGDYVAVPKLKGVRSTPWWDHLLVEMPVGQSPKRYRHEETADALRLGFKGQRLVMTTLEPRLIELAFMRRDPLLTSVPATALPTSGEAIDWRHVPVGLDEFGNPYTISLLGGHTVVAGSTGGGKASLGWNVLRAVAPAIAAGLVRPVGIDPKLMELSKAAKLFAPGDYVGLGSGETEEELAEATLEFLQGLVEEMLKAKAEAAAAGARDFQPTKDRPLTLILIDELAPLLSIWPRRIHDKIEDLLRLLLTQGRAVGFIVLGAIQEPTKDVFRVRDLFTRRLALRLPTESFTEAALIEKAVDFGALCHEIPESLPGVFFSLQDGARSTVRARFGHVTDDHIDELVAYLTPSATVVELGDRVGKSTVAA
jgi:DNA segregation ATPase FtsK/SpoIIIE, S-DNA-T family